MWRAVGIFLVAFTLNSVLGSDEPKSKIVVLSDGIVKGVKYWDGDFYEFYGITYAEVPKGQNKYQAPLPVKPWDGLLEATLKTTACQQSYFTVEQEDDEFILSGEEDCLVMNLLVPEIASEKNLVPVVVYIHSGAFAGGNGNMARFHYLARHDIIVVSFNYRLGALGFACLGNKEIPGNAGLKDQVAALRWINKNIKKFGGDPNKVTLAGFSVGASMAELLILSKTTEGLIDKLILESGSALSPFAINRDPINTAKNIGYAMGYNGTGTLESLTEFYLNVSIDELAGKSLNFFLPNSTFGFSPCIENIHEGIEPFLTESPMDIFKKGQNSKVSLLTGFANMEGISRTIKFGEWRDLMGQDFSPFLPVDLKFNDEKSKENLIKEIRERYFKGVEVTYDKIQGYVDYFSDAMFKYSIMKSLRLHASLTKRPIYLYEFGFIGKLNMHHNYQDRIKGASHRDQTAYILDFFGWTNDYRELDMRDRMTTMWSDFIKYGDPTAYESQLITFKWLPYTNDNQIYLEIQDAQTLKKDLFVDGYNFWNKIYEKFYWNPSVPIPPKVEPVVQKVVKEEKPKIAAKNKDAVNTKTAQGTQTTDEKKSDDKKSEVEKKEIPSKEQKDTKQVKEEVKQIINKEETKIKEHIVKELNQKEKEEKPNVSKSKEEVSNIKQKLSKEDVVAHKMEKEKMK